MTLISRIFGFFRDVVIARAFGAGMTTDAFFVAFALPNMLRRLFAEGAFSHAFVPILSEYKNMQGEDKTKKLVDLVATLLFLAVFAVTLVGVIGAPIIVRIIAPGFYSHPDQFALTVELTRMTFPYILFISLTALAGGILNTFSRFTIPAFTPVLLNLSIIGMALYAAPHFSQPVIALGWAVFLGGMLQLLLQTPSLQRIGMLPRFALSLNDPGVNRILKLMAPAVLGVSATQISLLINIMHASRLESGSVSWIYYADRLMEFPTSLLGVALGTILLPSLSKCYASGDFDEYSRLLDWGLRLTLLLAVPAAVALAILSVPIISTLFFRGAFTAESVFNTSNALAAYSIGLTALILVKVLAPGFYARQNIRTPVKIAILSLVVTQSLNLVFIYVLHFKHVSLALSISLAACLNATLLYIGLLRQKIFSPQPGWLSFFAKLTIALVVMGVALIFSKGVSGNFLELTSIERLARLSLIIGFGSAAYFATLWCCGFRLHDFKRYVTAAALSSTSKCDNSKTTEE